MPPLAELLERETALVAAFIAILGEQQEALKLGNIEPLPGIDQRKAVLAEQLNAIEIQRNGLLRQAGMEESRVGMSRWLASRAADPAAAQAWEKLLQLAAEARDLNLLNGKLIALRLQHTNQALAALGGQDQQSALYGRDGQATPPTGSRVIDAA